ncbi:MAG: hypothetical protein JNL11_02975 [Bdellovibrionaceae bacterium]|nr:hypothetical protein [Pseudobdellovibrionaceae bacterium]
MHSGELPFTASDWLMNGLRLAFGACRISCYFFEWQMLRKYRMLLVLGRWQNGYL